MTKKVLIVEDDDDQRRGLGLRLISWGYAVVQASDGYYAMDVARREMPDAVLLDIGLPGGDGISVLERYAINLQLSTIPVIVVTGRDWFDVEPLVRQYHVAAVLHKPVDNDELERALADALVRTMRPSAVT
jgi:DNA-binding response OmpR family regulator